jgi:hypothetical protein
MIAGESDVTRQKSGHLAPVPLRGHPVVLREQGKHHGAVSSTAQLPAGPRRAPAASMTAHLVCDLERFWPSRRGHAFDELCR